MKKQFNEKLKDFREKHLKTQAEMSDILGIAERMYSYYELGIEADFYSLKHSSADDIAQLYGLAAAQGFIGHTSEKVTRIYATGQGERDLDAMKRIDNKFSEE